MTDRFIGMAESARVLGVHPEAVRSVLDRAGVLVFKAGHRVFAFREDLERFAETYSHRAWWQGEAEQRLRAMWGHMPISQIAEKLECTRTAVEVKAQRLKLRSPASWAHILTQSQLSPMLGLDRKAVYKLMQDDGPLPVFILYKRDTPVRVVDERDMIRWLKKPESWVYINVDKVAHLPFRSAMLGAMKKWRDAWLTPGEVARVMGFSDSRPVNKLVRQGALKGVKHGNWRILRSSMEACMMARREAI